MENIIITYENYKGGINNLIIARNGYFGESAYSLISKERAIQNLKRKMKNK